MSKFKLTYDEKRYLLGLLERIIIEQKDILETKGEYPDGKTSASGSTIYPSQTEYIILLEAIHKKVSTLKIKEELT